MHYRSFEYRHAETILNANFRLKKEIEQILAGLDLRPPSPFLKADPQNPHRQIQRAFIRHHWTPEVLVSPRTQHRHHFDIFKERVGVEIELSSRDRLYRDYWRFLLAELDGRLDVGVIILFDEGTDLASACGCRNGLPHLADVVDDLNTLRTAITVPIWVIALS